MFWWFTEKELKHKFGQPRFYTVHYFITFFFKRVSETQTRLKLLSRSGYEKDNGNNDCTVQLVLYFIIYINIICCFLRPVFIYLIVAIVGVGGNELRRL